RFRLVSGLAAPSRTPGGGRAKKEGAAFTTPPLYGERPGEPAGLGGFTLVRGGRGFLCQVRLDAVDLVEVPPPHPAAQVDELAPRAAEREVGPFLRALPFHLPVADRAAYPNHRTLTHRTWAFCRPTLPRPPSPPGRALRPCRWNLPCRTGRPCRPPGPP